MTILPGLTSTKKERIPRFVEDLRRSDVRALALFPTLLDPDERRELYRELATIPGLAIPHVHLRTDFTEDEMQFLVEQFNTELFNVHPQASRHPFGPVPPRFAARIFVENVEVPPAPEDIDPIGGLCPDYSHLESARRMGNDDYVRVFERQLGEYRIGCCHVSAIRDGEPNDWNGGPDHHDFRELSDLDYLVRYADVLPRTWVSLELENSLEEQLAAARYLAASVRELTALPGAAD